MKNPYGKSYLAAKKKLIEKIKSGEIKSRPFEGIKDSKGKK